MNTRLRLLGTLGMIGSPMLLLESILYGFQRHESGPLVGVLSFVYIVGWLCSIIGLSTLNATGTSRLGRAVLGVQLVGLTLAAAWAIFCIIPISDKDSIFYQVTDAAWPLSHVFMIVVGIAALLAKQLPGWQRFVPLLCGLALPVGVLGGAIGGGLMADITFSVATALAFFLLGYAVRTHDHAIHGSYASSLA